MCISLNICWNEERFEQTLYRKTRLKSSEDGNFSESPDVLGTIKRRDAMSAFPNL
jgi:hypothetical protein